MDYQHLPPASLTRADNEKAANQPRSSSTALWVTSSSSLTTPDLPSGMTSITITGVQSSPRVAANSSNCSAQQLNRESDKADEIPFSTFTCFGKLPLELRRKIYKEACKVPLTLNVLAGSYSLTGLPSSLVNLAILRASSESRATALEVLKPVFSTHIRAQYNYGGRHKATLKSEAMYGKVVMSSNDILYLNSICADGEHEAATASLTFLNARACLSVTSVAFNTTVLKDTQYGAYKWLKVLAWTSPSLKVILVDRLTPPHSSDSLLPDMQQVEDPQEDSQCHTQVNNFRSKDIPQAQPGALIELIDLDEGVCKAFDDQMKEAIAKLANRPSDLTIWGVLGFDVPITNKADFKIPTFKRMGLTQGGVRI